MPHEHGNVGRDVGCLRREGRLREDGPIRGQARTGHRVAVRNHLQGGQHLVHRHSLQRGEVALGDIQRGEQLRGDLPSFLRRDGIGAEPALLDGLVEQSLRSRHRQQRGNFRAAAGVAEDRHVVRVPAELRDVIPHPAQPRDKIKLADIGRGRACRHEIAEIEIAEEIEPVVDRHDHDVVTIGQPQPFRKAIGARADRQAAAMRPEHHRALAAVVEARCPDVEDEAILALIGHRLAAGRSELWSGRAIT